MKKIFLTSGLVLCMACPAMATPQNVQSGASQCIETNLGTTQGIVNLEPIWTNNKYSITYDTDSNGIASSPVTDNNIEFNVTNYSIKSEGTGSGESGITSSPGYHITGWVGLTSGEGTTDTTYNALSVGERTYAVDDAFNPYHIAGNLTLTAQHAANVTTITGYTCTGTEPTGATKTVNATYADSQTQAGSAIASGWATTATYGQSFTFATNTCTLEGYSFNGWSCTGSDDSSAAVDSLESTYTSGETVNPWSYLGAHNGTLSCAATWSQNDYTISYSCGVDINDQSAGNPSGVTTANTNVKMDGQYNLAPSSVCSLPGYTFIGWDCPNLTGTKTMPEEAETKTYFASAASGKYSYANNVTCTAKWKQNNITLQWFTDDGTENVPGEQFTPENNAAASCAYDGALTLPTNAPTKAGYTLTGWKVRD